MALPTGGSFRVVHTLDCAVRLREEYVRRLHDAAFDDLGDAPDPVETGNNLDMLRVSTVEVVEAIVAWRAATGERDYLWQGASNYLLKMMTDCDFLAQNAAIAEWMPFDPVRNPLLLPPVSASSPDGYSAAFEHMRLGSSGAAQYAPIVPFDMSLERLVLAAKVIVEVEAELGAQPLPEDAGLATAMPTPLRAGGSATPSPAPGPGLSQDSWLSTTSRTSTATLGASTTARRGAQPPWDASRGPVSRPSTMATTRRYPTTQKAAGKGRDVKALRRAAAAQRRKDKRDERDRRNRHRNTQMSSSQRVGTHQEPMIGHLGMSEAARLAARSRALKADLAVLRGRAQVLRASVARAQEFTARLPTTSAADAYMLGLEDRWPGKRVAINDPHSDDRDPARYVKALARTEAQGGRPRRAATPGDAPVSPPRARGSRADGDGSAVVGVRAVQPRSMALAHTLPQPRSRRPRVANSRRGQRGGSGHPGSPMHASRSTTALPALRPGSRGPAQVRQQQQRQQQHHQQRRSSADIGKEVFDSAVASALSWLTPPPSTSPAAAGAPRDAWAQPNPMPSPTGNARSNTVGVKLPSVSRATSGNTGQQRPAGDSSGDERGASGRTTLPPGRTQDELDAREADRRELDLRPAMVPWPHPMCVAPASELSVRQAHLARVMAVVNARTAQLRRTRLRRKELKTKGTATQTRTSEDHATRVLGSMDAGDSDEAPAPRRKGRKGRRGRKRRKGRTAPPAQVSPRVVLVPKRDPAAHSAFADADLAFVEPSFMVFDGARQQRTLESKLDRGEAEAGDPTAAAASAAASDGTEAGIGDAPASATSKADGGDAQHGAATAASATASAPPGGRLPNDALVDMISQLLQFAMTTSTRVCDLLTARPFQMRFLANQGAPAPAVRRLMTAVLTLMSGLPDHVLPPRPPLAPTQHPAPQRKRARARGARSGRDSDGGSGSDAVPGPHAGKRRRRAGGSKPGGGKPRRVTGSPAGGPLLAAWDADGGASSDGEASLPRPAAHAGASSPLVPVPSPQPPARTTGYAVGGKASKPIDLRTIDWVNASDCLKHADFASVWLKAAASCAADTARLEMQARQQRMEAAQESARLAGANEEEAQAAGEAVVRDREAAGEWSLVEGGWRLHEDRMEVVRRLLATREMEDVRGAGASFHGPTAQVLLLWLKAVVALQDMSAVLRGEPGSYARMFGEPEAPLLAEAEAPALPSTPPPVLQVQAQDEAPVTPASPADALVLLTSPTPEPSSPPVPPPEPELVQPTRRFDATVPGVEGHVPLPSAAAWQAVALHGMRLTGYRRGNDDDGEPSRWAWGSSLFELGTSTPVAGNSSATQHLPHAATHAPAAGWESAGLAALADTSLDAVLGGVGGTGDQDDGHGPPPGVVVLDHTVMDSRRRRLAALVLSVLPDRTACVEVTAFANAAPDAPIVFGLRATNVSLDVAGDKRWNHAQLVHMLSTMVRQCATDGQWVVLSARVSVTVTDNGGAGASDPVGRAVAAGDSLATALLSVLSRAREALPVPRRTQFRICVAASTAPAPGGAFGAMGTRAAAASDTVWVVAWRGVVRVGATRCWASVHLSVPAALAAATEAGVRDVASVASVRVVVMDPPTATSHTVVLPGDAVPGLTTPALAHAFTSPGSAAADVPGVASQHALHSAAARQVAAWLSTKLGWGGTVRVATGGNDAAAADAPQPRLTATLACTADAGLPSCACVASQRAWQRAPGVVAVGCAPVDASHDAASQLVAVAHAPGSSASGDASGAGPPETATADAAVLTAVLGARPVHRFAVRVHAGAGASGGGSQASTCLLVRAYRSFGVPRLVLVARDLETNEAVTHLVASTEVEHSSQVAPLAHGGTPVTAASVSQVVAALPLTAVAKWLPAPANDSTAARNAAPAAPRAAVELLARVLASSGAGAVSEPAAAVEVVVPAAQAHHGHQHHADGNAATDGPATRAMVSVDSDDGCSLVLFMVARHTASHAWRELHTLHVNRAPTAAALLDRGPTALGHVVHLRHGQTADGDGGTEATRYVTGLELSSALATAMCGEQCGAWELHMRYRMTLHGRTKVDARLDFADANALPSARTTSAGTSTVPVHLCPVARLVATFTAAPGADDGAGGNDHGGAGASGSGDVHAVDALRRGPMCATLLVSFDGVLPTAASCDRYARSGGASQQELQGMRALAHDVRQRLAQYIMAHVQFSDAPPAVQMRR